VRVRRGKVSLRRIWERISRMQMSLLGKIEKTCIVGARGHGEF
jgi:hypothetical protein